MEAPYGHVRTYRGGIELRDSDYVCASEHVVGPWYPQMGPFLRDW